MFTSLVKLRVSQTEIPKFYRYSRRLKTTPNLYNFPIVNTRDYLMFGELW